MIVEFPRKRMLDDYNDGALYLAVQKTDNGWVVNVNMAEKKKIFVYKTEEKNELLNDISKFIG